MEVQVGVVVEDFAAGGGTFKLPGNRELFYFGQSTAKDVTIVDGRIEFVDLPPGRRPKYPKQGDRIAFIYNPLRLMLDGWVPYESYQRALETVEQSKLLRRSIS